MKDGQKVGQRKGGTEGVAPPEAEVWLRHCLSVFSLRFVICSR